MTLSPIEVLMIPALPLLALGLYASWLKWKEDHDTLPGGRPRPFRMKRKLHINRID